MEVHAFFKIGMENQYFFALWYPKFMVCWIKKQQAKINFYLWFVISAYDF
jgi:hypothetical protein